MSKNKKMTDQLAALRKQAVNDQPASPKKKKRTALRAGAVGKKGPRRPLTGERERQTVNLTPEAQEALRSLQTFMITECGTGSASASAVMCIALELAAESMKTKKKKITEIHAAIVNTDGRRSA